MNVHLRSVAALFGLAAALLAPSASFAAGDWLPTQKVTEADRSRPQVGMFPNGETIAVWGVAHGPVGPPEWLTHLPGTPFAPAQPLATENGAAPALALNDAGAAAAAWSRDLQNGREVPPLIALRPPGGAFGEPREVPDLYPQIGIDRAGNGYALVLRRGANSDQIAVATVPADGSATVEREIAQAPAIDGPSMAVDAGGTVTVAWRGVRDGETSDQSHVFVATAAPGAPFGEPAVVSSAYHDNNLSSQATRVVSNARGDTLVLWPVLDLQSSSPYAADQAIRAAFRPAGGAFGPEEQVPTPDAQARGVFHWDAAMGGDGQAVVAWSSLRSVAMTYRPPSGPFEPAQLPPAFPVCCDTQTTAHSDPAVAFDGAGDAAVAYRSQGRVEVVRRPRASPAFLAPQSAGESPDNFDPDIAFDASGRGIVIWAAQEQSSSDASHTDHGIFAAEYDPTAPPRLTSIVVRSKLRLGLEATDQGRARLTLRRKGVGRMGRTLVKRPAVVPGYNAITLTPKERRLLARKARYVAVATVTDSAGHTSAPTTVRFRAP